MKLLNNTCNYQEFLNGKTQNIYYIYDYCHPPKGVEIIMY